MDATALAEAMPDLSLARAKELADGCNEAMLQADITTLKRAAMFLAQIGHESISLKVKEEIGHGAGRRYVPYYGRGFIQLTWKSNYQKFGEWCKTRKLVKDASVFVTKPDLVTEDSWAWLSAVYFWSDHNLNSLAEGDDNVRRVTRVINGKKMLGLESRRQRYERCLGLGDRILPQAKDWFDMATDADLERIFVKVLRQAVGPDDAKTPAGLYFGRVEKKLDKALAEQETLKHEVAKIKAKLGIP
ncbi:MAG TPA: chitinase [Actinomycetes bacterium]|jgi:predicted chitinase|nr:chitinase [Actinomycetes bacterium]